MPKFIKNLYKRYNRFSSPFHKEQSNSINNKETLDLFDLNKIYFYGFSK